MLIEATTKTVPPEERKGVERLLGTINCRTKFIPRKYWVTQPISTSYSTGKSPRKTLLRIARKNLIRSTNDYHLLLREETCYWLVAATKSVLKAVILQGNKHIVDALIAVTDAETRYPQIQKNCSHRHLEAFSSIHIWSWHRRRK